MDTYILGFCQRLASRLQRSAWFGSIDIGAQIQFLFFFFSKLIIPITLKPLWLDFCSFLGRFEWSYQSHEFRKSEDKTTQALLVQKR